MTKLANPFAYFDRRSIRYPLARLMITVFLAGTSLVFVTDSVLMLGNVHADIDRSLNATADAAGTAANAAVVFHDARAAGEILRMLDAFPQIEAAALYTNDGNMLAGYGNSNLLPDHASVWNELPQEIAPMAGTALRLRPIRVDGITVGAVGVKARLDKDWHTYISSVALTGGIGLIVGALALILAMRYLDKILRPIRLLAKSADEARRQQNFDPPDIPAEDNEIGHLVKNFNALISEIGASRVSLLAQQEDLERLVERRTSDLLAAKMSAEAANKDKSRFLASASHDLRQPIHAMRLFLDTLGNTSLDPEQKKIIHYLSLSARNLADILNTLLDISKLDSGMLQPNLTSTPAIELFRIFESEFAPLALEKGLRFKLFIPLREINLLTDAKPLQSLLNNLVGNAIKYTQRGGVLVGIRQRGGNAVIQVWDTGIGIAPDHLNAIYDEYFQIGNLQRDSAKGLGLGLSIAKRMANLLGTRILCHSRLNRGTLFEVVIPLAMDGIPAPDMAAAERALPIPDAAPLHGHVAVIDDDSIVTTALELGLRAHGLRVTVHPSAEQALADPGIEQADFYVADYRLPGMNGIDLLDALQKRAGRPLRTTLLTGDTFQQGLKIDPAMRCTVLFKPLDLSTLLATFAAQKAANPD